MNKIYKVIFNRNKNRYEIVSELASSRGGKCKVKAGKQIAKLFMTGLLATFLSSVALAAEQEVVVKYDDATGTIKIVKVSDGSEVASYAVGGNISPITSIGTEKDKEIVTKNPTGIIAIGDQSKAVQSNSIAIGADAHAGDLTPAKDKEGKDKDYPLDNSNGYIAIGTKAVASGDRSIALGNLSSDNGGSYNIVQGKDSIGIGTSTSVFGYSGVSIGRRNIIGVPDPDLVKEGVLTTKARTKYSENDLGGNSVIVGAYNVAYGNRSNIIGTYSRAMGSNSVAIGSGVQSLSDGAIAIGKGSGYEFADGSRFKNGEDVRGDYYGRDWELPPEYKVLKQVLSNDINGDKPYKKSSSGRKEGKYKYEKGGSLPKYNNYGAGSSDPGGFIVEGQNALGIGTYTQVRGDSAIGLATGEMTADLSDKDKSAYARDMRKIMDMEETLYDAKEALKAGTGDTAALESAVKAAEESLSAAKKTFRETYLKKYSFVDGDGALGVGRQILAQGDRSMAVGDYAKAISSDAIAYGGQTLANGTNSMAMGGAAKVGTEEQNYDNSMAIGSHTNVQAGNAVALGAFTQVTGTNSLALGFGTQNGDSINYNTVSGRDSTLIGSYSTVQGSNSILIGSSGNIANDRVVALGNNINIAEADPNDQENNTAGSVFLGDHAGYVKDSKRSRSLGQVDVVGSAGKMELTESLSSTKGALRDYTKDFIYIYMLERQDDGTQIGAPIAVRSDFAGGDSTVGVVSVGSTYEQKFKDLTAIKDYHTKVGSLITVPVEVEVEVTKNGIKLGKQNQTRYFAADSTEEAINADNTLSEADKKKVWDAIQAKTSSSDSTYTVFETRRIQNVAPGLIGVNSTDAINGSQLFATNQMLGNLVGSLKKTFGDNVNITEDGQIKVSGEGTLGWIAKAKVADSSNGTVDYQVGKDDKITKDNLKEKGSAIEAADQLVFQAGKNIGLVQTPDTLTISTIDTPSFTSVTTGSGDNTTVMNQDGVTIKAKTDNTDGTKTDHKTSITKDGLATDGTVEVTNGKDGDQAKNLVTIGKNVDPNAPAGTDGENGTIGLDGKNGSSATITVDRGTSSLDDTKNIGGTDPKQDINENNPAKMDRITYTTKDKNGKDVITHEVATMDDGLFFSGDSADGKDGNVKNKFDRKLSQETKIIGGVNLGLQADATAKQRQEAITAKLTDGNIGVISDGSDTLTVKLAKQLTGLDSATYTSPTTKTGDGDATSTMKVDGNGVRFVGDNNAVKTDAPSLTTDGITGGNKTITDVASGIGGKVKDPDKNNANTFLENVNKIGKKDGDQPAADAISENVVVNAKDLKNLVDTGFKLNTSGQGTAGASTVKIGDTINIIDGANTKVSAIDDSTTGTHTFHIDVTGMPISYTDNQGNALTKIGDKYYKNTDIENGKPKTDATEVPADEVTNNIKVINKDGTTNNQGTISNVKSVFDSNIGNGADTGSKIDEIKDGSVISNTGSNQFINDLTKLNDQADLNATDAEAEKTRAKKDEEKLNSVSTVRDLQKVALTPLFFEGDTAESATTKNAFGRKLSEKTKIVGGQKDVNQLTDDNIGVVSNGTDTLTIKLAKNLVNLTSVETGSGNNKTKMTENGVTTTVKDGDTFKVTTTTPNGLATTEVKLDSDDKPTGESTTTMVTTDGVTITTQTPPDPDGDKPASTTETKLSKDGLATDGTIKVIGDNAKDLVTIGKGTDGSGTDKEYGKIGLDGKNGSNATLTVDRGTKSVTDKANILKDPKQPAGDNNPVSMDRLTYTTTGADGKSIINHEVATLDDGFFLTTEHTEADKTRTVLFNNTIKVLDGANTKVSAMGGKDGTHTFSIDVTGLPVTYTATKTDANGAPTGEPVDVSKVGDGYQLADGTKLVKVGDKYYKPSQLGTNGQPNAGEEGLTIKQSVSLVQDNGAPATLERVGSGRRDGMKADADPMAWDKILNPSDADKAKVDDMLTNAANIGDVRDAIKSITNGTDDNAIGGFGLTGNNGEVKQDLGKTITIKGGIETKHDAATNKDVPAKSTTDKNTYVNVKDVPNADGNGTHKEMVIEIAKDLTDLDSVTVGSVDPTTGKGETTKITGKDVTIKDKAGNTNTSTTTKDELTNANGDKTTVEAGKVDVSKKNADGTTSNTNIDGSKITLENKDKDSNTVGSKTDIGTDGIRITYKDDKGKTDPKKDVSLTDKGLNNGGNQIKNVGSGLVDENGKDITDISNITNSDILSNGVNVGDLQKAINSVTNSSNGGGFGLTGNNGKIMQDLGKTITIKGGIANKKDDSGKDLPAKSTTAQNTYVNVKNNEMVVEIAKDLTDLDSVTIGNVDKKGNGGTVINKDGMTVKDATGNNSTSIGTGTIGTSTTVGNGKTSSTNIDGSTITLENKDKDGKLTGPKTEVSNKGITITPVDEDGKPIEGKKVELSDKGLDNGGNQIKHVDSGLKKENGDSVKLEDAADDMLNNAVNVGDLKSVNEKLKDDIINISNQVDDIKNSAPVVYLDKDGNRVYKNGHDFFYKDGKKVKEGDKKYIRLSLVNADGKTTTPSTLQNVAKGVKDTDAVNVKQLEEATEKPLTFNGDAGSYSATLGATVAIKGGANRADLTNNNIGVIVDSTKTLNVKLSKKLKGLESAEFVDNNGNTTNITGDGVHISGGNGSNVSLTSQGLNNGGNRITNVAPGVEATDAVNVSQLNQVGAALHNRINNVAKGAYGGVASAGAMASLPQAYLPGKSMVAAGASHYRGESAVALGASRISDNGKIILKLNASHNTSGNTMVGAGVGYQF